MVLFKFAYFIILWLRSEKVQDRLFMVFFKFAYFIILAVPVAQLAVTASPVTFQVNWISALGMSLIVWTQNDECYALSIIPTWGRTSQ